MAQAELDQLGNLRGPQYRFESYPPDMFIAGYGPEEGSRKGSMVPFELFVLKARLQGHLGDIYEAIDQLYDLIMRCKKVCGGGSSNGGKCTSIGKNKANTFPFQNVDLWRI